MNSHFHLPNVSHFHLQANASQIPLLDPPADILIGRDLICAHKVRRQHSGPHNVTYSQLLNLGWVIVGERFASAEITNPL